MIICILFGFLAALADWRFRTPNPIPYMTAGAGFVGGLAYIILLILGKWVE